MQVSMITPSSHTSSSQLRLRTIVILPRHEVWELASYTARNYRKTHDKAMPAPLETGAQVSECLVEERFSLRQPLQLQLHAKVH